MITDHVYIGDVSMSNDAYLLTSNKVTHILNTNGDLVLNLFDIHLQSTHHVKEEVEAMKPD